jgi:Ca2+-transporting ATPase
LNLAIVWQLLLLGLTVYVPFLQTPFDTYGLPWQDWLIVITLSLTILPVLELAKWMVRHGWFAQRDCHTP